jgi:uncharacterized ion transporter superfamily protein YfcC
MKTESLPLAPAQEKKIKFKMPDTYIILFLILLIAVIATYVVPAGEFTRKKTGDLTVVVPGTYHIVNHVSTSLLDITLAIEKGMVQSANIIFLILFMGGFIEILNATGSLSSGIMKAIEKTKGKQFLLISTVFLIFSIEGAMGLFANSCMPFVPIGIILARAIKLDPIVGVAITFGATFTGFNVGFVNPYTVGIAQNIAQLPMFSGLLFRIIVFIVIDAVTLLYIWNYSKKIIADPSRSIVADLSFNYNEHESNKRVTFTNQHKMILSFVVVGFIFLVFCNIKYHWTLDQMSGYILILSIGSAILGKIHYNQFVKHFISGAQKLVYGALIVGAARAILVVLEQGKILDTIVFHLSNFLGQFSPIFAAIAMFIANTVIKFFIPSGSGHAMVVMPIMTPLADMVGITRQVAVSAFQFGDGFTNTIFPTSGPLMASLAIAGIPWTRWIKWMMPLLAIWIVIAIVTLVIGVLIHWGPA